MEEPMETVQGASQARQAAARAQMTGFYQEWPLDKPDPKQKKLRSPGIKPRSLNYQ
jgi:hypothetical protein